MRRFPIMATLVVTLAIAAMIGLGIWQIRRAQWKEALLASYNAAAGAPMMESMPRDNPTGRVAFRRVHIGCRLTTATTPLGGVNKSGRSGFRNIAGCRLADGRELAVDLGWNGVGENLPMPPIGRMLDVSGQVIPDDVIVRRVIGEGALTLPLLLVAETPAPGLEPSIPPSIADIPNNHISYAVQWFLFAGVALVIFGLAMRKRMKLIG